ncbi:U3 small nucleolar RNA-associated protein [Thraustotheca clavata]|uniref:U3 small nucleolar RNA-associated protein 11 n=1 Tax=Thraustotheca clavata TaxID=74557 RepID=A0A1V9ZYT7_9STRA|nr:U3 small nucleolar RNA-associated protein [Thraustotheca clavata]
MSSLRNAVKRREHKERGQPLERKKLGLGLLEKHKDYVQRARDFHSKEKRLNAMKLKAALRNPDEFYFKMNTSSTVNGKHVSTNNNREKLTADVLKVMKTQDVAYMHMKRAIDQSKAQKLSATAHFIDMEKSNKHTVFVDDETQVKTFDAAKHFDTVPELVHHASNRLRKADLEKIDLPDIKVKKSNKLYQEMSDRLERAQKINRMRQVLDLERNVQAKGKKMKISNGVDGGPAVYKWKRVRTR